MNFVADENIWASMIRAVREESHKVYAIAEEQPGIEDEEVLDLAHTRKELLLTSDKGFGSLVFDEYHPTAGILLLRLREYDAELRNAVTIDALRTHGDMLLHKFSVLKLTDLRTRELP